MKSSSNTFYDICGKYTVFYMLLIIGLILFDSIGSCFFDFSLGWYLHDQHSIYITILTFTVNLLLFLSWIGLFFNLLLVHKKENPKWNIWIVLFIFFNGFAFIIYYISVVRKQTASCAIDESKYMLYNCEMDINGYISYQSSRYVLNLLPPEDLPAIAIKLIENGFESKLLIHIAGMNKPTYAEIGHNIFEIALKELDIQLPNKYKAEVIYAQDIARKLLSGVLSPLEATKRLYWDLIDGDIKEKRIEDFAILGITYEHENNKKKKQIDDLIYKQAKIILDIVP